MLIAFILMTTFSTAHAGYRKPEASLKQCQYWKDEIKEYSELRRRGGTAKKMDKWYRAREDLEDKFSEYDCRYWGKKLK